MGEGGRGKGGAPFEVSLQAAAALSASLCFPLPSSPFPLQSVYIAGNCFFNASSFGLSLITM